MVIIDEFIFIRSYLDNYIRNLLILNLEWLLKQDNIKYIEIEYNNILLCINILN